MTATEILIALGARVRVLPQLLREKLSVGIEMDWAGTAEVVCAEALAVVRALVMPEEGAGPVPECAHCRAARYSVLPDVPGRYMLNSQVLGSIQIPEIAPHAIAREVRACFDLQ